MANGYDARAMQGGAAGFTGINAFLAKHSDLLIAAGVILILAMMVIRIPQGMVDVMIGVNLSAAAVVLLVALYVPDATKLPSFPTILLLATLFRLGINVTTTRLILLEANAGEIIDAFGDFVVGGNFVVGGVVFIVIVLVQFLVISKGSERVAEVSARFTLDAMPGKQMSIDADMRSGVISPEEGRRKRQELEKESKLYGAMDGAMKFVKGDAIAGIVISLINIIGGLIIGVMQQGMSAGEAAQIYSLLTIGDGLVSQIPALLISVAAGLVVTRVAAGDKESGSHVASEMFQQILAQPKAIGVVTVVLIGMGFLPGFPSEVFWVLAAVAGVMAFTARSGGPAAEAVGIGGGRPSHDDEDEAGEQRDPGHARGPRMIPVLLEIHPDLEMHFVQQQTIPGPDGQPRRVPVPLPMVEQQLGMLRAQLQEELGMSLPPAIVNIDGKAFDEPGYLIRLFDAPVARGRVDTEKLYAFGPIDDARALELGLTERATLPWSRAEVPVVGIDESDAIMEKLSSGANGSIRLLGPRDVIVEHLRIVLKRHADELMGIQESSDLTERMNQTRPELVKAVVPTLLNHAQLTEVLQGLLHERIPIRDLRSIMESIARWGPRVRGDGGMIDVNTLTELVRRDLRRAMCAHYAGGRQTLNMYAVAPEVENAIAEAMQQTGGEMRLTLGPEERREIIGRFAEAIDPKAHFEKPAVVVVNQPSVRRPLWHLLDAHLPEVVVLSYQDLAPEMDVQRAGVVSMNGAAVV